MPKTIHRREYRVSLDLLPELRGQGNLPQVELSQALGRPQSFVSDIERGVRRLDIVQLRDMCTLFDTDLTSFVQTFEAKLDQRPGKRQR